MIHPILPLVSGTNVSLAAAAAASAVSTAPTTSIASTAPASKPRTRRQSLQFLVSSVPSLHRTLLKQRSELDLQKALQDQQTKVSTSIISHTHLLSDSIFCLLANLLYVCLCLSVYLSAHCSWMICTRTQHHQCWPSSRTK